MPTPFPGMDPYLERPGFWEEVHAGLIVGIQQFLNPLVRPNYRVVIERRTYITLVNPEDFSGKPDVLLIAAREPQLETAPSMTLAPVRPRLAELPMPEEITERYLEIRDVLSGEVITVIEILSPGNKRTAEGRKQYERKRLQIMDGVSR